MKAFLVVCILSSVCLARAADVARPCFDGSFEDVKVLIGDVECTESPCQLTRGQYANAIISFVATATDQLIMKANATVSGTSVTVSYKVPDADKGCDKLQEGAYCPLTEGEVVPILISVFVDKIFPKVSLLLRIFVTDVEGTVLGCFDMDGVVTD